MVYATPQTSRQAMLNERLRRIGDRQTKAFVSAWLTDSINQFGAVPDGDRDSLLGQVRDLHEEKYKTTDSRVPTGTIRHGHVTHLGRYVYGQPVPALQSWDGDVGTISTAHGRGKQATTQGQGQKRWRKFTGITAIVFMNRTAKDTDEYKWYLETRNDDGDVLTTTPVGSFVGTVGSAKKWRKHWFRNLDPAKTYYAVVEWTKGYGQIFDGGDELTGTESHGFRFVNLGKSGSKTADFVGTGVENGIGTNFANMHLMSDDETSGPDEYVITLGTNEQGNSNFYDNLIQIVEWVRLINPTCLVWLALPGLPGACQPSVWKTMIEDQFRVAAKKPWVGVIPFTDIYTKNGIPNWTPGSNEAVMYGPLHPNAEGYKIYAGVAFNNLTGAAVPVIDDEDDGAGDDTAGPSITIQAPANGAVAGATTEFRARVVDPGTGVDGVYLLVPNSDETLVKLERTSGNAADGVYAGSVSLTNLKAYAPDGTGLRIRAFDVAGNQRDTATFSVSYGTTSLPPADTTGPTVRIVSPADDTVVPVGGTVDFVFEVTDPSGVGASRGIFAQPGGAVIGNGSPSALPDLGAGYYGHRGVTYSTLKTLGTTRWTAVFRDASPASNPTTTVARTLTLAVESGTPTVTPAPVITAVTPGALFEIAATATKQTISATITHPLGIANASVYVYGSGAAIVLGPLTRVGTSNVWSASFDVGEMQSSNRFSVVTAANKADGDALPKTARSAEIPFTFATGVDTTAPVVTGQSPLAGTVVGETVEFRARVVDAQSGVAEVFVVKAGSDAHILDLDKASGTVADGVWSASIPREDLRALNSTGAGFTIRAVDEAGNIGNSAAFSIAYPATTDTPTDAFVPVLSGTTRLPGEPAVLAAWDARFGGAGVAFATDPDGTPVLVIAG
jgi:hypothetical protein